jgi:hypothetical protein
MQAVLGAVSPAGQNRAMAIVSEQSARWRGFLGSVVYPQIARFSPADRERVRQFNELWNQMVTEKVVLIRRATNDTEAERIARTLSAQRATLENSVADVIRYLATDPTVEKEGAEEEEDHLLPAWAWALIGVGGGLLLLGGFAVGTRGRRRLPVTVASYHYQPNRRRRQR